MAALLSIAVLALLIVTTASAQRQKVVTVAIRDFYFEPSQLLIEPGTTVRWINEGNSQHTVFATSPAGAFLSETLVPGESFTHTFPQRFPRASPDSSTKRGTYEYLCKIHPGMKASVTFSESGGEATTQEKVPTQEKAPTQGRDDTRSQQTQAVPSSGEGPSQEREDTAVQQPTAPRTGGLYPLLLIGLLVIVAALGVLRWAVRRGSS